MLSGKLPFQKMNKKLNFKLLLKIEGVQYEKNKVEGHR